MMWNDRDMDEHHVFDHNKPHENGVAIMTTPSSEVDNEIESHPHLHNGHMDEDEDGSHLPPPRTTT